MMKVGSHGEGGDECRLEKLIEGNKKEKYKVTDIESIDLSRRESECLSANSKIMGFQLMGSTRSYIHTLAPRLSVRYENVEVL